MKRIVVGMDEAARDALAWAAAVAAATGAEVVMVNAFVPEQSELPPGRLDQLRDEQAQRLAAWGSGVPNEASSTQKVVDGDPRDVLPETVEQIGADLLVVAGQEETGQGLDVLRIGNVVESLARQIEHPMAVIPPGASPTIERIVIGVDGSEHGVSAMTWTAALADATGASVTAVAVTEPDHPIATDGEPTKGQEEAQRAMVNDWTRPLDYLGDRLDRVVIGEREIPEGIMDFADRVDADVVVVGARGVGGLTGLRLGSTALAVLHRSARPLVLVPTPE